ncbi:MAG: bifunctional copper resistance protein CopD/cytochrome c oxidase assembly protein [Micrococcales bacterium]|nr:bifunctional copper resistance protein CopD/cytochrome c oxidase assembly protein [Micrococcales bacterium]
MWGPAAIVAAAAASLAAALLFGGAVTAPLVLDPGALARWGVPAAKLVVDLAVGVVLGALLLALTALSPERPEYPRALDVAAAAGGVWAIGSAASAFFTYWSLANRLPDPATGGSDLGAYLTTGGLGQAWLVMTVAGAAITVLCLALRNRVALLLIAAIALAALARLSNEGHSGDSSTHDIAATAIWLHILFAGVWLGGLVTVVILRPTLGDGRIAVVLRRYSSIAAIAFVVVAISGYASAAIRLGQLPALLTPYGVLVLVKIAALLALGLFGAAQRRAMIRRIGSGAGSRVFWVMVGAELGFMGIASGVAAALASTATPVLDEGTSDLATPTPAQVLTDRPLPPELTPAGWITAWYPDLLWLVLVLFGTFFYLAGVWRLRRRGDRWPVGRTVSWLAGMLLLLWSTNGMPNLYQEYLFSVHMTAHMLLSMAVPILLVLGAPVTLSARAIRARDDGSRGPREWILWAVHTPVANVLTNPLVAAGLFAISLWGFYYTPLFRWAVTDHLGHVWMTFHFLITGYLFVQALIGIDPVRSRPPYPLRLVLLLAVMALHAFFGLTIISSEGLFLADWYGAMGRTWGPTPLADQQAAGGIAWSIGEIPTLALAIAVAILWSRSDDREAKRRDRKADRDGDAELAEYNRMLAGRAR